MNTRTAIAIIGALAFSTAAHADWQYVKWGMSKQAAIAASKGEARAVTNDPNVVCAFTTQRPFATIPRKVLGEFTVQVTLCTDGGEKVTSVALSPVQETNLHILRNSLVARYGQPTVVSGTHVWNDAKSGNTVSYYQISDIIGRIEYKKLGGSSGL